MSRGTRLEIRPMAVLANARLARRYAGSSYLYAMIKANAYGHGLESIARVLQSDVDGFGVAVIDEAIVLRQASIDAPVMLLEGIFDQQEVMLAQQYGLQVVIHSNWQLPLIAAAEARLPVWLKVNTGMHRLGVSPEDAPLLIQQIRKSRHLELMGLMTHFSCADVVDDNMSQQQLTLIRSLAEQYQLPWSAANSAALLRYKNAHGDRVRPGIMLYGSSPLENHSAVELDLKVTQRFSARIIAINEVAAGGAVGYGATWQAPVAGRIGVVAAGYGDGYPRHAPSGTPVSVAGCLARLAGRVSMDMLTIDLTDLPQICVGDEVELWGDHVSVDDVAAACGTISYELFCRMTSRPERVISEEAF